MKILFFGLDLTAIYCIFKNILRAKINTSRLAIACSNILTLMYCIYLFTHNKSVMPYSLVAAVIIYILFDETWYLKLSWLCICSLLFTLLPMLPVLTLCMVTSINIDFMSAYYKYFDLAVLLIIPPLTIQKQKKFMNHTPLLRTIGFKGYFLIIIIAVIDFFLSSISTLLFTDELSVFGRKLIIVAIFVMIVMSVVLLTLYFRLQHYHLVLQQTNYVNQKMLELEKQHYHDLQQKNMDLRAFRHDYNSHITAMHGLVADNDLPGLKKYVKQLSDVKEFLHDWNANHPVADAIVNYFYEHLPAHTTFQQEGKFPEHIFVTDSDLCVVLSNLLKNATEAVRKQPEQDDRKIYISFYSNEEYLSITIENTSLPIQEKELEQLTTAKTDTLNHGLGLKNVRMIVKRYQGTLSLQYEDNLFTACAILRNIY